MTQSKAKKVILIGSLFAALSFELSGCSALTTAIEHHNLETDSKMSQSIFLDPIPKENQSIYVQVKNTTSEKINLKDALVKDLESNGWTVTDDLSKAHDMVQVNVLQIGKAQNKQSVWASMNSGFGNALLGGLAGVAGGYMTNSVAAGIGIGSAVGLGSLAIDSMVKDVTYSMITDVQVSVKTDGEVTQTTQSNLSQGSATNTTQTYKQKTNWLRYRTRIASIADQMNLDFEDAKPVLVKQVSKEISGIFIG